MGLRQAVVRIPLKYALGEAASLFFQKIESARLVALVGPSRDGFQSIWRIVFKGNVRLPERLPDMPGISNVEVISRSGNEFLLYMARKTADYEPLSRIRHLMPWEVDSGNVRVTILGTEEEIREWLGELDKNKIPFIVDSMGGELSIHLNSFSELTGKQKEVLVNAYRRGYYEIPRKSSLGEIAKSMKLDESTVAEHLRKAESILIQRTVTEAHLFANSS